MTKRRTVMLAFPALIILLLGLFCSAAAGDKIAVLVSSAGPPFEEALVGFKAHFAKQGVLAKYEVYRLAGDVAQAEQALLKIRGNGTRLIFTIGSIATETAIRTVSDLPIIYCLVLRADSFANAPNATGVALEFPIELQFSWIKKMLPETETIGVIYNPAENKKRVEEAARIARKLGLHLSALEVRTPQDIPSALQNVSKTSDVLWGLPDAVTLSSQMAKHILLFSFRNKIPFVGPSSAWVKAGALYSLDWDYHELGAQSGAMAIQTLRGTLPRDLPPATPKKILYSINQKTAEQLKIEIPMELVRKAGTLY